MRRQMFDVLRSFEVYALNVGPHINAMPDEFGQLFGICDAVRRAEQVKFASGRCTLHPSPKRFTIGVLQRTKQ